MPADRNLLILHTPGAQDLSDWRSVKNKITALAPDIEVRIGENGKPDPVTSQWQITRPSLVFSPIGLHRYGLQGGKVYDGRDIDKLTEIRRLKEAGVSVPRTQELLPGLAPSAEVWGEYLIVKPIRGSLGQGIRLVKTKELASMCRSLTNLGRDRMMVQQYIDQVDTDGHLIDWRVLMIFGNAIYASRRRSVVKRRPLDEIVRDPMGVIASNVYGTKRGWELVYDEDVIDLAAQACTALNEIPVLGIDIARDANTGGLFVFECNGGGNTWHISSIHGRRIFREGHRRSLYSQFGALDVVAEALVEKTRAEAC